MEVIMMERAACALEGLCSDGLNDPWTLIKEYINIRQTA